MTPEDRGERGAALSVADVEADHAQLSREDRAAKCLSGLVVPEKAVCPCGAILVGPISLSGKTSEVRTCVRGLRQTAHAHEASPTRQAMCANRSPRRRFDKFEEELQPRPSESRKVPGGA